VFVSTLPDEVTGKHWVVDVDKAGAARRLASVEALAGEWVIYPQGGAILVSPDGSEVHSAPLCSDEGLCHLQVPGEACSALLVETLAEQDKTFKKLGFTQDIDLTIGRNSSNLFELAAGIVSSHHAVLRFARGGFQITDLRSANGVFVNGRAIRKSTPTPLAVGDVVFIFGLKIAIGRCFIAYNNPGGRLTVHEHPAFIRYRPQAAPTEPLAPFIELQEHCFYRSPRIKRDIEEKAFVIDDPPAPTEAEETPLLLRVGPSVGMAFASVFMGLYMATSLMAGSGNGFRMVPMLAMVIVMVLGAVLWPNLSARYTRRKNAEKETRRVESYSAYLDKVRSQISNELTLQKQILTENRVSVAECFGRVGKRDRRLFERTPVHVDFLSLRIGIGDVPLAATFRWPQEKPALKDDVLKSEAVKLSQQPYVVRNAPLALSLPADYVAGVMGRKEAVYPFLRGLIVQIVTLHAPDEVKLVILCNEREKTEWEFAFSLPHVFDDTHSVRFVATGPDEAAELSLRLERELHQRLETHVDVVGDYGTYYVILALDHGLASRTEAISRLTALRENKGFSVLACAESIRDLPKECSRIVHVGSLQDKQGTPDSQLFNPHDPVGLKTSFLSDIAVDIMDAQHFGIALSRIGAQGASSLQELPKSLGFLELFEAAKVEHLNIVSRWQDNNPCISLAAPIGIDASGATSILNIHEDFHGPHGLIAGMTGSGKSEFIIAYILSLAINYRPDEVSFVLIDYKGGGLAGAFDNDRMRLPHLAGTITNLDGAAIARSLISINSELRRRQDAFNRARDISGLGTMDIYKYQELHRLGVVREPIPHLLIISDEFAELKAQEPEFMDQLISAARIGRSLGVHLILATQKPSGVVNDQIWSNARFKVCLKVAEPADSREMLKTPDAAELVDPGRYYLQVGYNEYYALGQSCYAGTQYRPVEHFVKRHDNSVTLISSTGRGLLSIKPEPKGLQVSAEPESVAVLKHLVQIAQDEQLFAPELWLAPIPEIITVDELIEKYHPVSEDTRILNPILGEFDDPGNQRQALLTLPLSQEGNAIIYGSTGSGKASLVSALLYSLLKTHTVREINVYLLDFGAETLGAFRDAPQVGDVVFAGEDEKVENLFRMLLGELERRRKLVSDADGSFLTCARQSVDPLPSILVVINSFEVFIELYDRYIDELVTLSRDGIRGGIIFLLTCSRSSGVSYRLLSNFQQKFVLKLNNADEYLNLLGSMRKAVIPDAYERGLVRLDALYEFQGARLSASGHEREAINAFVNKLQETTAARADSERAPEIPSLPVHVNAEVLCAMGAAVRQETIPIGVNRENISVVGFDFARSPVMLVLSENEELEPGFLCGLVEEMGPQAALRMTIMDPNQLLDMVYGDRGENIKLLREPDEISQFVEALIQGAASDEFVMIVSLRDVLSVLESPLRGSLETYLQNRGYRSLAGLIVSGQPSRFSSFSYEPWFRELSSSGNGIWLGDGVNGQTVLKTSRPISSAAASPPEGFAWYINRGVPVLIKYIRLKNDSKDGF
jgi:S-DNA-T family DNA segregation ATPase FtsK/SpoIIIE